MLNFAGILDHNLGRYPDKTVLAQGERRLSNRELFARVNALAAGFRELGIGRGDIVALLLYNHVEFVEAVFALNRVGAAFLPLNYRLSPSEWEFILSHAEATAILTEPEFAGAVEGIPVRHKLLLGAERDGWLAYDDLLSRHLGEEVPVEQVGPDDLQRLMYTSGTTSRPKGVRITHTNLLYKNLGHLVEFGITSADTTLVCGPLYHVGGLDLPGLGTLHAGGGLVLLRKFDARAVLDTIERERPTNVWLAPSMMNALLQQPDVVRRDTSSIRFIIGGGEKMPVPLVERIRSAFPSAWFADAYGLTETVSGDTFNDAEHMLAKVGSVGRPVVHLRVRIVDELGAEVPPGQLGEITLSGPKVFAGYWRDAEATAKALRDGWFHTGDIGRVDEDGYLYVEDRKKDMIVSGGENIATPEVERVLYEHPEVVEAAVVGMPHERWGEVPKAFVVLRPGSALTAEELTAFCRERLAKFKVPAEVRFLGELPRTPSGKVLKRDLRTLPVIA
ncbi:long-chain fatty acid--CoA ligase [Amycolatopsis acidiphila]|uniref:Long-chain fatty acid--CoA ligase n=1 Tax=Amycolatopsis acidiphila TaxID=715473 RepID=A0A558ALU9_9PSEU|nr:long-chain fatty acid--CoA ligase [Amycolatopsis acidiphila]TVT25220.1 long-chain fatty acid--CoA ligase [Amycolatopsis acidiphila]UIJ62336.1 long-chain fatty acid--CoA ligase [Amycolatopsis acidiphila]GHG83119.1 fatty-acyl-CoA synthase [Amycolatopsis acidiphila]